jgi:hypothetical protein
VLTDVALNLYYNAWSPMQLVNYGAFALIILFGSRFNPHASFLKLLSGGILGAILFYFLTNTAAWMINPYNNPEYTKDLLGWITALTSGTKGYPTTLEFFRNTLLSGGLFTGLFVGALKLTESPAEKGEESEKEPAKVPEGDAEGEPAPEHGKA